MVRSVGGNIFGDELVILLRETDEEMFEGLLQLVIYNQKKIIGVRGSNTQAMERIRNGFGSKLAVIDPPEDCQYDYLIIIEGWGSETRENKKPVILVSNYGKDNMKVQIKDHE